MLVARCITPSVEDVEWLRRQVSSSMTSKRLAERCRIVLLAIEGQTYEQIAGTLGISRQKASRWRTRFVEWGRPGLEHDAPGPGAEAGS
jgi:hypothetical protein